MSTASASDGSSASSQSSSIATSTIPNLSTIVWRSLVGYRGLHIALALGIAAATAVVVGALVVGDSMRGSLQTLVLERLGQVDSVMLSQRFFEPKMLDDGIQGIGPKQVTIAPLIVLPSSAVELQGEQGLQRASQVQLLGVEDAFWSTISNDQAFRSVKLATDEVAINTALANELGAKVGDQLTLRLPKGSGVPADSPLGRRDDAPPSLPGQRIAAILPNHSVADLDFRAGQQPTLNVFVPVAAVQDALEKPGRVNAALALLPADQQHASLSEAQLFCDQMNSRIKPQLADYGLKLTRHVRRFPDESIGESADQPTDQPVTVFDYYQITSDQMIIDEPSTQVLTESLSSLAPARSLSYLVNEIKVVTSTGAASPDQSVTYSIVTGLEDWESRMLGITPHDFFDGRSATCGVTSWLANRLHLQPNSVIRLHYYRPETMEGAEVEVSQDFNVTSVVPLTEPKRGYVRNKPAVFDELPTKANDPDLTPVVPGITDQDSISKWDLPFELTRKIPPEDDEYWKDHRLTPKIYMSYKNAQRYFGSRFGSATAIRMNTSQVNNAGLDEEGLRQKAAEALLSTKATLGMQWIPIRQTQLHAASGTTPFDGLFMALSFFVIVAALMLVALLFRLSIEQRSSQWGLLMATGYDHSRVRSLVLRESFIVILVGVLVGLLLGMGYARLMIAGLRSWWAGAVSGDFLNYHVTPPSLLIGGFVGGLASLFTILWCARRIKRQAPLDLLRGRWDAAGANDHHPNKAPLAIAGFMAFGSVGLLILGLTQSGMAQAGSFFGCGMCLLVAALATIIYSLKARITTAPTQSRPGLWNLAWLALMRNVWRSVLTIGLLSVASFLIASMSLFQISPDLQGSGGFELMAQSSLPIYRDLGSTRVREETLSKENFENLRTATILSFRERPGEDASCNNLYQVSQPTILGIPEALARHQSTAPESHRFQWAATVPGNETPWDKLEQFASGTDGDPIPVVLDMNTAAWSLHQGASIGAITRIRFDDRVIHFQTVGLLSNSVMQGKLLISEVNFKALFPEISGYRYFLIHDDQKEMQQLSQALENGWSDEGLDVSSTQEALVKLLAVQNTYISAFQAIGALGLLLGTVGLAVVQVRSVLERKRELALMQAVGFSKPRIASLLLAEAALLLVGGIVIGILAAGIAIVPHLITSPSQVGFAEPLVMLAIVLAVGLIASSIAVVVSLRQPLLRNLVN